MINFLSLSTLQINFEILKTIEFCFKNHQNGHKGTKLLESEIRIEQVLN